MNKLNKILSVAVLGLAGVLGFKAFGKESTPDNREVSEVASYVESSIPGLDTSDHSDKDGKLVYLFPDVHCTSYHAAHKDDLEGLQKRMGLKLVGIEGQPEGEVTPETIEEDFENYLILHKKNGKVHQLAEQEEHFFGKKPKSIKTLEDFLEVSPLSNFAFPGDGITLVGLEDQDTSKYGQNLFLLKKTYEMYFKHVKKFDDKEKRLETFEKQLKGKKFGRVKNEDYSKELERIRGIIENEREQARPAREYLTTLMEEYKKKLDISLPDYAEEIRDNKYPCGTPFSKALSKADGFLTLNQRSKDSVRIMLEEMDKRGLDQGAMVYGQAHLDQMKAALDKRGASYIVVKVKR